MHASFIDLSRSIQDPADVRGLPVIHLVPSVLFCWFMLQENLNYFIKACKKLGLKGGQLFDPTDLIIDDQAGTKFQRWEIGCAKKANARIHQHFGNDFQGVELAVTKCIMSSMIADESGLYFYRLWLSPELAAMNFPAADTGRWGCDSVFFALLFVCFVFV